MRAKQTLGDKINRGFAFTVILLFSIMIIRFSISVARGDIEDIKSYPETQDDLGETANGLDVPRSLVDTTVDEAYVNGFFND